MCRINFVLLTYQCILIDIDFIAAVSEKMGFELVFIKAYEYRHISISKVWGSENENKL